MWKWFRNLWVLLGTVSLLVCISRLPKIIAFVQDKEILSQVQLEEIQSIQLDVQKSLPTLGKLALMKNANQGNVVEIAEEDASMSAEEVEVYARKALQTYYEAGLFSMFADSYCKYRTLLVWGSQNTMVSGIVWEWNLVTQDGFQEMFLLIDDETGEILRIHYWGDNIRTNFSEEEALAVISQIYFANLQIADFKKYKTNDLEKEYIGEQIGVRYRFEDAVYGEINVDFFLSKNGCYMEFPVRSVNE